MLCAVLLAPTGLFKGLGLRFGVAVSNERSCAKEMYKKLFLGAWQATGLGPGQGSHGGKVMAILCMDSCGSGKEGRDRGLKEGMVDMSCFFHGSS